MFPSPEVLDPETIKKLQYIANVPAPVAQPAPVAPQIPPPVPQMGPVSQNAFAPVPLTPEQIAYGQTAQQVPQRADYQPSRLRTVLNAIAGGFAGAAGHPEMGAKLRDLPYTQALQDYETKVAGKKVASDLSTKSTEEGIKRGVALTGAEYKAAESGRKAEETGIKKQEQLSKDAHRKALEKYTAWKMANPKLDDFQYIMSLEGDEQKQAMDMLKQIRTVNRESPEEAAKKEGAKTTARLEAQDTPLGRRVAQSQSGARATGTAQVQASPLGAAAAKNVAQARTEGTEAGKPGLDPVIQDQLTRMKLIDPASYEAAINKMTPKERKQAQQKVGVPTHYSTRESDRIYASLITNKHLDTMTELAHDPYIASHIGPIIGRVMDAEGTIGAGFMGETPEQQKKIGEFLNFISYMIAWESTNLSAGTRPAWQLIMQLKKTGPKAAMTPAMMDGAIKGARDSVQNTMKVLNPNWKSDDEKKSGGFDWSKVKIKE